MKSKTHRTCKYSECGKEFRMWKTTEKYCSLDCKIADGAIASSKPKTTASNQLKRTPLKRNTTPIKKVSEKRAKKDKVYSVLRKLFLADPKNQYCIVTGQPTIEIHHTFCGKDRDKYYLDTTTWMAVSRAGHNYIHDNQKESRELGYLK